MYTTKTRWFLVIISCLVAAASAAGGIFLGLWSGILIAGVIAQPRFQNLGRGLICSGALLLSAFVFAVTFFMVTERNAASIITAPEVGTYVTAVMTAACDIAIVMEELRIRRSEADVKTQVRILTTDH